MISPRILDFHIPGLSIHGGLYRSHYRDLHGLSGLAYMGLPIQACLYGLTYPGLPINYTGPTVTRLHRVIIVMNQIST